MKDDYITGVLEEFDELPQVKALHSVGGAEETIGVLKAFVLEALQGYGQWQRQALAEEVKLLLFIPQKGSHAVTYNMALRHALDLIELPPTRKSKKV